MERIKGKLNPSSPEEYMEALMRICEKTMDAWEELPDGDGEEEESNKTLTTKTGMFQVIRGCANYGLDSLKMKHFINHIS